jgi:hypothetical protein
MAQRELDASKLSLEQGYTGIQKKDIGPILFFQT